MYITITSKGIFMTAAAAAAVVVAVVVAVAVAAATAVSFDYRCFSSPTAWIGSVYQRWRMVSVGFYRSLCLLCWIPSSSAQSLQPKPEPKETKQERSGPELLLSAILSSVTNGGIVDAGGALQ